MLGTLSRSTTPSTRRLEPSWKPWTPEPYQLRGSAFLQGQSAAVLWLDPGMRKTSIALHAFCTLQSRGEAKRMLVVAPKRVCELVWRQEAAKWDEFRHLNVTFLHGPKKAKLLGDGADVHLINPEGAVWLAKQYAGCPHLWPYDTVIFDELTKFKNSQAERSKALRGRGGLPNLLKRSVRRWGATGTPNPNGYMDLFGQFLMLDDGAALGRFVTHYRDTYFTADYNGFDYVLQSGAEKRIQARLAPYVFALDANDYLTLPALQDNIIEIELEPEARAAMDAMRKEMVAALPEGIVEAANTAASYTKLSQMAGGAVYMADGSVQEIHTAKLDALSDLIDELQGQQMLIGYEFTHEKDRLKARFGNRMSFLSDARTAAQADEMQRDWNAGRIQLLACHPASAGHGLNLQESNAHHLCWFGPIWDLELWDQFVRRLLRSGNTASHVMRHILVVRSSIDELKLQGLAEKDTSQNRLKRALTTVLSGEQTDFRSQDMVMKLQRAGAPASSASAPATERKAPAGWGTPKGDAANDAVGEPNTGNTQAAAPEERRAPAGWGAPKGAPVSEVQEQRAEIQEKLNPETAADVETVADPANRGGFSGDVIAARAALEGGAGPEEAEQAPFEPGPATEPAKRTRARSIDPTPPASGLSIQDIKDAVADAMNQPRPPRPLDEDQHAGRQLAELLNGAKAAAEAVATIASTGNEEATGATYVLLFGAIEARLAKLGYTAAVDAAQ